LLFYIDYWKKNSKISRRTKMSSIGTAQVTITGTRPLFIHWFGPDAIPLEKNREEQISNAERREE
jgi:hypothetical protein